MRRSLPLLSAVLLACDPTGPGLQLDVAGGADIMVDSTLNLQDSVQAPGRVTWLSLDTTIATVDQLGNVTARGIGTARIVVTADTMVRIIPVRGLVRVEQLLLEARTCLLTTDSLVFCWDSWWPSASRPARIPVPRMASLFGNQQRVCGLTAQGAAWCWGGESPLGSGVTPEPYPSRVAGGHSFTTLAVGERHTCGLEENGALYCWGDNRAHTITAAQPSVVPTPVRVADTIAFTAIAAGGSTMCGIDTGGAALCWGWSPTDATGDDAGSSVCWFGSACTGAPRRIASDSAFTRVFTNGLHSCALTETGQAWCWGYNADWQLGDTVFTGCRNETICSTTPQPVRTSLRFTSLALGSYTSCGPTSTGDAWCWGYVFMLGGDWSATPVTVAGGPVQNIWAGSAITCARRLGTVTCLGYVEDQALPLSYQP